MEKAIFKTDINATEEEKAMVREAFENSSHVTVKQIDDFVLFFLERNVLHKKNVYKVIEYFPREEDDIETYVPLMYEVTNLTFEYDKKADWIMGEDAEEEMANSNFKPYPTLNAFMRESLIYIGFQEYYRKVTLTFDHGFVQIFY